MVSVLTIFDVHGNLSFGRPKPNKVRRILMLYIDAVFLAMRVAEQTRTPQFVVGRDDRWAIGNYRLKPIEGFTVHKVVPRLSGVSSGGAIEDADDGI